MSWSRLYWLCFCCVVAWLDCEMYVCVCVGTELMFNIRCDCCFYIFVLIRSHWIDERFGVLSAEYGRASYNEVCVSCFVHTTKQCCFLLFATSMAVHASSQSLSLLLSLVCSFTLSIARIHTEPLTDSCVVQIVYAGYNDYDLYVWWMRGCAFDSYNA